MADRPDYGTPVTDAPSGGPETLQQMADNGDYRDAEKPVGSPPTPRRTPGTRGPE